MTIQTAEARKNELLELIEAHHRRLFRLRLRKAQLGINTSPEIEIEIEEILQQLDLLKRELAQLDPATPPPADPPRSVPVFSDRKSETEKLLNPRCPPYVLLDAPIGYGKTRLLHELRPWFKPEGGWACAYVDFRAASQRLTEQAIIDLVGVDIAGYQPPETRRAASLGPLVAAMNRRDVLLIFDSVEVLDERLARWLVHTFTAAIPDRHRDFDYRRTYRVIFAGRHVAARWSQFPGAPLGIHMLPPFDLNAIGDAVRSTADALGVKLVSDSITWMSQAIFECTGGHPDCIATVLTNLALVDFADFRDQLSPDGQARIYDEIVAPAIDKIKRGFPESIRPALEALSVFRRFARHTICHLLDRGDIPARAGAGALDDPATHLYTEITATNLVQLKQRCLSDDIVRRLLAMELRHTDPQRYARLCHIADQYYLNLFEHPNFLDPELVTIERTFQRLQHYAATARPARRKLRAELLAIFKAYLDQATSLGDRRGFLDSLKQELRQDWEWQYLIGSLLGARAFESILVELKQTCAPDTGGR